MINLVTKTVDINLVPLQVVAFSQNSIGPVFGPFDVSNVKTMNLYTHIGRIDTNADSASLSFINIEASSKSTGDSDWYVINSISGFNISPGPNMQVVSVNGSAPSGQSVLPVSSTSLLFFSNNMIIFIVNPTFSSSEFGQIKNFNSTSITLTGNLTNDQSGSTIYLSNYPYSPFNFGANRIPTTLDCTAIKRIRFVVSDTGGYPSYNAAISIDATTQSLPSISC